MGVMAGGGGLFGGLKNFDNSSREALGCCSTLKSFSGAIDYGTGPQPKTGLGLRGTLAGNLHKDQGQGQGQGTTIQGHSIFQD